MHIKSRKAVLLSNLPNLLDVPRQVLPYVRKLKSFVSDSQSLRIMYTNVQINTVFVRLQCPDYIHI